jgi:type II secretion system protein J
MKKQGGFTLVELIVATTIFVLILGAAYSLFDSGRNLTARAEGRAQFHQALRAAIKAIEEDLKGALMPNAAYDTGFIGTDGGSGDQPLDKIEFITVNAHTMPRSLKADTAQQPIVSPRSDMTKVTYWVEGDTKQPAHGLVRNRQPILNPVNVQNIRDEDIEGIAPEVVYLNLRYYDTDWQDSWDSTQVRKLPKAVEVTLHLQGEWRGEKFIEKFTARFYLPVAAETPEKATP